MIGLFDGRILLEVKPQTIGTDLLAEKIVTKAYQEIDAQTDISDDEKIRLKSRAQGLAFMCSMSELTFEFQGDERRALITFKEWWENKLNHTPEKYWDLFQSLPHIIYSPWTLAFNELYDETKILWGASPAEKATKNLTKSEKVEAANPNSPLASPEDSLPGK